MNHVHYLTMPIKSFFFIFAASKLKALLHINYHLKSASEFYVTNLIIFSKVIPFTPNIPIMKNNRPIGMLIRETPNNEKVLFSQTLFFLLTLK